MKGKVYKTVFVVVLLNILGVISDKDVSNEEESATNYEYIQIFKSIPALFEYLLDALEERPEILEKNDVTTFKRNIDGLETEDSDFYDETTKDKRCANCDQTNTNDKHGRNNVGKRDTYVSNYSSETTVAYEYGNSNVIMKGLNEIESAKVISKRFTSNGNKILNRQFLKNENKIKDRKKWNTLFKLDDDINVIFDNYGDMFFGFEHLFGLDLKPEEIEERILIAEKLLEEHHNKKDNK